MTTNNNNPERQQQIQRMLELGKIARKRYLDAGDNPHLSVGTIHNNNTLTDEERQEISQIANQFFSDQYIADDIKRNGTFSE